MKYTSTNLPISLQLILRLLLVLFCYTLSRICFFLFNMSDFVEVNWSDFMLIMRGGFIFDRTAILYTNALVVLLMILPFKFRFTKIYQNITHWIFLICNSLCLLINTADIVYYEFTKKRTTATIFKEFQHDNNLGQIFQTALIDYIGVTLSGVALIGLFIFLAHKIKYAKNYIASNKLFYPANFVFMLLMAGLFVGGVRGGFTGSTRPITLSNASKFVNEPKQLAIVLNTPFSIIRTLGKTSLIKRNYFSPDELKQFFNAEKPACSGDSSLNNANVVVIILESFGRANIGHLNRDIEGYVGFTPFLDSLSQHCYSFKHAFANGRKSIDALPSSITSIPSINEPFILSPYSNNTLNSLASLAKKKNYYTAFFHGAPNGSMGFDAFAKQAGYEDYFGKDEYNNDADFDNIWGIWDEPFLQYFAKTMNSFQQPFLTSVFTLSSHHPFKVPAHYEGVFPKGEVPLQQCIGYSDNALRKFFDTAKTMPWFNNTIFVITADHMSTHSLDKYNTDWGTFAIPMMFYVPGHDEFIGFNDSTIVQQTDILPTVAQLIGSPSPYISFGNDMFGENDEHFVFNHKDGIYILIEAGYLLQFDGEKSIGLYDLANDAYMKNNTVNTNLEIQSKLENRVKAIIQDYADRFIENRLTAK